MNPRFTLLCLALSLPVLAQDEEAPKPVTQSIALKLGVEALAEKYTGESEAGLDEAATLYATAKRMETESKLAKVDLRLVSELDSWRGPMQECRRDPIMLASILSGGGTMYSHAAQRDAADMEDFLAKLSARLPLKEGKGSPKAIAKMDAALAKIKALKPADLGDAEANKEAASQMKENKAEALEHFETMKSMISYIPAEQSAMIVDFVVGGLSWLEETE
jgi:histidyl-tRNA synthetase